MSDRLLPTADVLSRIGLGRTTLHHMVKDGAFPRPIKVGRVCLWSERAVNDWIAERLAEVEQIEN